MKGVGWSGEIPDLLLNDSGFEFSYFNNLVLKEPIPILLI
jgi:hypothetical protein